jgi:hypothetical protein
MRALILLVLCALTASAPAQWDILPAPTTADLRGVSAPTPNLVWVSGTHGTVLRSTDAGKTWLPCATPPNAEPLDFRAIQAFDANTAIVMSSGKGDLSRLYKTTNACQSWTLLFTNPDKEGFWDAITAHRGGEHDLSTCPSDSKAITGSIFGDPAVHKSNPSDKVTIPSFYLATFTIGSICAPDALNPSASAIFSSPHEAAFAASNSVLYQAGSTSFWLATGTELIQYTTGHSSSRGYDVFSVCSINFPVRHSTDSQGIFSFAVRSESIEAPKAVKLSSGPHCLASDMVAVGGDYLAPDDSSTTAVLTAGSRKFQLATTPPHGYRSAVAYSAPTHTWITVGPNGTDISTDDGRNWRALLPLPGEAPDSAQHWNALALPFVVGPHGRVGILNPAALKPTPTKP